MVTAKLNSTGNYIYVIDATYHRELIILLKDILEVLATFSHDESISYEESLRLIKLTSTVHLMLDYFKQHN
jgi:hypothetical protein